MSLPVFHSLIYIYIFKIRLDHLRQTQLGAGVGGRLAVCPETVSPPVIVADRRPNQRHHHHGDDGRCNLRYPVACGNPGEQGRVSGKTAPVGTPCASIDSSLTPAPGPPHPPIHGKRMEFIEEAQGMHPALSNRCLLTTSDPSGASNSFVQKIHIYNLMGVSG